MSMQRFRNFVERLKLYVLLAALYAADISSMRIQHFRQLLLCHAMQGSIAPYLIPNRFC